MARDIVEETPPDPKDERPAFPLVRSYAVGLRGLEPRTSSLSAICGEPPFGGPFLQVARDRRCQVICSISVQLCALPMRLQTHRRHAGHYLGLHRTPCSAQGAGRRSIPEGGYSPCLTCAISPASFSAVPFTSYFAAF